MKSILVTGGAGFIGSHVVRRLVQRYPHYRIVNLDLLTYAGNLLTIKDLEQTPNYTFVKGDICDADLMAQLFTQYQFTDVIHLAAESHVDRSILDPLSFVRTNVLGTVTLLNAARAAWQGRQDVRFYHISTDEVFGALGDTGYFAEATPYDPRSPYSASKASSDHFVRAYYHTYHLPVVISNCSNNYGPYQFPEKLIPLMILNLRDRKELPVYGQGLNVRDWLWVEDHAAAIDLILHEGQVGETYAIGGHNELRNIDVVHQLCTLMDQALGRPAGESAQLIRYVTDRPGHDHRYAIDCTKIETELGWRPTLTFEQGLRATVEWYLSHPEWIESIRSGSYRTYYDTQYGHRLS